MDIVSTRERPGMMDWRSLAALAAAITAIAGALVFVYRAVRGFSRREENVELVPTVASKVDALADKVDAITAKLDSVASAAVMVPTLREQMQAHDFKISTVVSTIDRVERKTENISNDLRAVEAGLAGVERDVSWLKRRANGVNHPGEGER